MKGGQESDNDECLATPRRKILRRWRCEHSDGKYSLAAIDFDNVGT
jgi:hypothetical protein